MTTPNHYPTTPPHHPRLLLVGPRGTGKSTAGRVVAARLGWAFADCDDAVEAAAGASIADIFRRHGEAGFRDREAAALAALCGRDNVVVATGGGAVVRPANRALLRAAGFVVWLTAPADVLFARLAADPGTAGRRPALTPLDGLAEVVALLAAREPLYREVADAVIDAGGPSPEAVATAILETWARSQRG